MPSPARSGIESVSGPAMVYIPHLVRGEDEDGGENEVHKREGLAKERGRMGEWCQAAAGMAEMRQKSGGKRFPTGGIHSGAHVGWFSGKMGMWGGGIQSPQNQRAAIVP